MRKHDESPYETIPTTEDILFCSWISICNGPPESNYNFNQKKKKNNMKVLHLPP